MGSGDIASIARLRHSTTNERGLLFVLESIPRVELQASLSFTYSRSVLQKIT